MRRPPGSAPDLAGKFTALPRPPSWIKGQVGMNKGEEEKGSKKEWRGRRGPGRRGPSFTPRSVRSL